MDVGEGVIGAELVDSRRIRADSGMARIGERLLGLGVLVLLVPLRGSQGVERGEGTCLDAACDRGKRDSGLLNVVVMTLSPSPSPRFMCSCRLRFCALLPPIIFCFGALRGVPGIRGNQGDRGVLRGDPLYLLLPVPCPLLEGLSSSSFIKPQCHSLVQAGSPAGVAGGRFFRIGTEPQVGGGGPVEPWALLSEPVRVWLPLLPDCRTLVKTERKAEGIPKRRNRGCIVGRHPQIMAMLSSRVNKIWVRTADQVMSLSSPFRLLYSTSCLATLIATTAAPVAKSTATPAFFCHGMFSLHKTGIGRTIKATSVAMLIHPTATCSLTILKQLALPLAGLLHAAPTG